MGKISPLLYSGKNVYPEFIHEEIQENPKYNEHFIKKKKSNSPLGTPSVNDKGNKCPGNRKTIRRQTQKTFSSQEPVLENSDSEPPEMRQR